MPVTSGCRSPEVRSLQESWKFLAAYMFPAGTGDNLGFEIPTLSSQGSLRTVLISVSPTANKNARETRAVRSLAIQFGQLIPTLRMSLGGDVDLSEI